MTRYDVDVDDAHGVHRDAFGKEFDSFEEARARAQSRRPDIAREEWSDGESHSETCDVRDETNRIVYRGKLTFEASRCPL